MGKALYWSSKFSEFFENKNKKSFISKFLFLQQVQLINRTQCKIGLFNLSKIFNAKNQSKFLPEKKSKSDFYASSESNFVVLEDQITVVGVQKSFKKNNILIQENVFKKNSKKTVSRIAIHDNTIRTILLSNQNGDLYVGDNSGLVTQYRRNNHSGIWKKLREYANLGIGGITTGTQWKGLFFFASNKGPYIRMLKESTGLMSLRLKTAMSRVESVRACRSPGSKSYLSVSGKGPNFSDSCSNIFEIAEKFPEKCPSQSESQFVSKDFFAEEFLFTRQVSSKKFYEEVQIMSSKSRVLELESIEPFLVPKKESAFECSSLVDRLVSMIEDHFNEHIIAINSRIRPTEDSQGLALTNRNIFAH